MGGLIDHRYMEPVPVGSKMVFIGITTAPLGWSVVTDTKYTYAGIRLVTNAAEGGGFNNTADAFGGHTHTLFHDHTNNLSVDGHALTVNEMPAHKHGIILSHETGGSHDAVGYPQTDNSGPFRTHSSANPTGVCINTDGANGNPLYNEGGGAAHSHTVSGSVGAASTATTSQFLPKYVNALVCSKDA